MRNRLAGVCAWLLTLVVPMGCSMHGGRAEEPKSAAPNSTFVYLVSGPNSGKGSPEMRKTIFAGHMANIKALALEGRLFIAGPFDAPADKTWRGIFVVNATTAEEATRIAASDPGIIAGEFKAVCHPMNAPEWLRELPEFDRKMTAGTPVDPTQPPKNIRAYVMVTAADGAKARRAIESSAWRDRIVWSGTFTDTNQGVFVMDAEKPEEFRAAGLDLGPCSIDGWWSSAWLAALSTKQKTH